MKWLYALLLLVGCQRHSQWHCHHIKEKTASCTRVLYSSNDQNAGIDLEFLRSGEELATYLQVHSQPIPVSEDQKARVILHTKEKNTSYLAPFHRGQQRIYLPEDAQLELITLLKEGKIITIELEGYRETIDLKRFETVFKKLDHPPYRNPLRLFF